MTAANRVGILAAVTNAMAELGGDLCEASQTVVRGFFTMIFAARFPERRDPQVILDHLHDVCRPYGIDVRLKDPQAEELVEAESLDRMVSLTMVGRNEPGVLRQIAGRLAVHDVDITRMHAVRLDEGGQFEMKMRLAIPLQLSPAGLETELETLGSELGFRVRIADSAGGPAALNES